MQDPVSHAQRNTCRAGRLRAVLLLLPLALLALPGCQSGRISNDMDATQENDLGKQFAQQINSQAKFVTDGKYNRRILAIAAPVFAQANKDRPDISFRVRVIDSPEVNAFSIPGGYVYVYRGLLDKLYRAMTTTPLPALSAMKAPSCAAMWSSKSLTRRARGFWLT